MKNLATTMVIILCSVATLFNFGCESMSVQSLSDTSSNSDIDSDSDSDSDADTDNDNDDDNDDSDSDTDECSDASKLVYLVDLNKNFYRFDPPAKSFELIGTLDCDAFGGRPFSMSVSRDEIAYVLYYSNYTDCVGLFPVSLDDASCGEQTEFECTTGDLELFGMGFATNGPDTTEETLHIGSIVGVANETGHLASLNTDNWFTSEIGTLTGDPEFTGNGNGELWGFFPNSHNPFVAQINKNTGSLLDQWFLPGVTGEPYGWAFAHWGGSYYVFYQTFSESSTNVYRFTDGDVELYMSNTGKTIVGAGVSTCAPTVPPV